MHRLPEAAQDTPAGIVRVAGDGRDPVDEFGAEDDVGIVEHALLEAHHDELTLGEVGFDHVPDVLSVAQIQRCIHLVDAQGSHQGRRLGLPPLVRCAVPLCSDVGGYPGAYLTPQADLRFRGANRSGAEVDKNGSSNPGWPRQECGLR